MSFEHVLICSERYHLSDFGYSIPNPGDGSYVLTLKFAEAYFKGPEQKVTNNSMVIDGC